MNKKTKINYCPHPIMLNDGETFSPSGIILRSGEEYSSFDENDICFIIPGALEAFRKDEIGKFTIPVLVPESESGKLFIVSGKVRTDFPEREDFISPASGHSDVERSSKGFISSVPGFVGNRKIEK